MYVLYIHIYISDCLDVDKLKDEDVFGAFSYLLSRIENLFEKMDFSKLKSVCMLRGVPLPRDFKQQITGATNFYDILEMFDNTIYCNWLNVHLLKKIANNIDDQEIGKAIKIYEDHIYSRKVSVVKNYFSLCFDEKAMSKIEVKINKGPEDLTVKQIIDCFGGLENVMDIYTGAISTIGSRPGCLRITVVIPLHCSLHAFKMAKRSFIKLRQFHIQYLEIESFSRVFAFNCCNDENAPMISSSDVPKCEFTYVKCLYTYVRMCMCMYVRMYVYMYVHIYVNVCINNSLVRHIQPALCYTRLQIILHKANYKLRIIHSQNYKFYYTKLYKWYY